MKGKTKIPKLTHERLLDVIEYNPDNGAFVWKVDQGYNKLVGQPAGGLNGQGYYSVRIDREDLTLGRLAFFYMTGEWPDRRVRFINKDSSDLRFSNLTLYSGVAGEFDHTSQEGRMAYLRAYRKLKPDLEKARALRDSFGISLDDYTKMHDDQGGKCAICGNPETQLRLGKVRALAVDHCHESGKVRGLLCSDCNTGIGKLKDNPDVLRRAAEYIQSHQQ